MATITAHLSSAELEARYEAADPSAKDEEFTRIRIDTLVGMAFSNIIAIAVIITTAATLDADGKTNIEALHRPPTLVRYGRSPAE